jgi:hypothetical protein
VALVVTRFEADSITESTAGAPLVVTRLPLGVHMNSPEEYPLNSPLFHDTILWLHFHAFFLLFLIWLAVLDCT